MLLSGAAGQWAGECLPVSGGATEWWGECLPAGVPGLNYCIARAGVRIATAGLVTALDCDSPGDSRARFAFDFLR